MLQREVVQRRHELARSEIARRTEDDKTSRLGSAPQSKAFAKRIGDGGGGHVRLARASRRGAAGAHVPAPPPPASGVPPPPPQAVLAVRPREPARSPPGGRDPLLH